MRTESHVATLVDDPGLRNATDLLARRRRFAPDHVAFSVPEGDGWRDVTTAEFGADVDSLAKGLMAVGVAPGDAVAIMASTSYAWTVADLAIWTAGGVVVPIYETSAPAQAAAILADSRPRVVLVGDAAKRAVIEGAVAGLDLDLVGIWTMTPDPDQDLAALGELGTTVSAGSLEARRRLADRDSLATIVYTSGTTSVSKGAMITHQNLVGVVSNVAAAYGPLIHERASTIIFLPLAHVLARGLQLVAIAAGMKVAHLSDPRRVVPSLAMLQPTFLVVVPRVLQKIHAAATAKAAEAHLSRLFDAAERTAVAWGGYAERHDADPTWKAPLGLRVRRAVFDRLFYRRLRALMGGRIEYLLSGAAALDANLSLFFRGIGVPVIEGYGLTETTAPATANLPGNIVSGTVGLPIPGTTIRIAPDDEVLVKGVGLFAGYHNPADNADAFSDGFFRTGDLGSLDDDGRLTLHGRAKDVIVTAAGKNVVPSPWENEVSADPLVAHALMVGEGRPYLGAILFVDSDELAVWARRHHRSDLASAASEPAPVPGRILDDPALTAALDALVARANTHVSRPEQVRRHLAVVADLSEAAGHLTPTQKLRRGPLLEQLGTLVDRLYEGDAHV